MSENTNPNPYRRSVAVASTILAGGILVSLAFNLKAISLTPDAGIGAYASGILWPLALLGSVELLIHTPWRAGISDKAVKVGVLILVACVAAWISYWHGVHVLDSWGYDEVGMRAGPVVPDAAMALATLALQRVAEAKRLAKIQTATVGQHMAAIVDTLAPGQHYAATDYMAKPLATEDKPEPVASTPEPANPLDALDEDWGNLEAELEAEGLAVPPPPAEEPAVPAEEPTQAPAATLTAVPAAAAQRIQEAAAAGSLEGKAGTALDLALAAEGLASSPRTARRYRAAIKNGTARVS